MTICLFCAVLNGVAAAESSIVIERCGVFDPESAQMQPEQTIVIRNERIVSVTGADATGNIPGDAMGIDGRGKFALPGPLAGTSASLLERGVTLQAFQS